MDKAWSIRPYFHKQDKNYAKDFLSKGIIATGPSNTKNLSGLDLEEIKRIIAGNRTKLERIAIGRMAMAAYNFVREMNIGDLVIMLDGEDVYVMEIASDYIYEVNIYGSLNFFSHTRKVKLLRKLERKVISVALGTKLRAGRQVQDISDFYEEIFSMAFDEEPMGKSLPTNAASVPISYRLRPDFEVKLELPQDMNQDEARRFSNFIKDMYFK